MADNLIAINTFDEAALQQLFDDIGPATGELMGHFITDIRGKIDDLMGISSEPDLASLIIHAHSLKGLCRTCGLIGIADLAFELEKACKSNRREQAITHFSGISENIDGMIETLQAFIDSQSKNQDF